jgi:hypothetical protein
MNGQQQENLIQENLQSQFRETLERGYNDIPYFAKEFLGIDMHEGQRRFCDNSKEKINVLIPGNRWGKTVTVGIKHIHHNFYKYGINVKDAEALLKARFETCNLSPDSKQAEEVYKVVVAILTSSFSIRAEDGSTTHNVCKIGGFLRRATESPSMMIEFDNNSLLLIRPTEQDRARSIAAKQFAYISYDEGCKSNHLETEVKSTILPRLADLSGTLDILSTPDSDSPSLIYYRELYWAGGGDDHPKRAGYYSQEGSALENPYLPKTYARDMELQYGNDPLLQQVLHGRFVITGSKVFDDEDILNAVDDKMEEYVPFQPGHQYVMGVDTAAGGDFFVICVIDKTENPLKVVRWSRKKGAEQPPMLHLQDVVDIYDHYNQEHSVEYIMDSSNEAGLIWQDLLPDRIKNIATFYGFGNKKRIDGIPADPRFNPTINTKEQIILSIKKALSDGKGERIPYGKVRYPRIKDLINELSIYRKRERGKRDDKFTTDCVIGFGLAIYQATDGQPTNPNMTPVGVSW